MVKHNVIDLDEKFRENRETRRAKRKTYGPVKMYDISWTLQRANQIALMGMAGEDAGSFLPFVLSMVHSCDDNGVQLEGEAARKRFLTLVQMDESMQEPEMLSDLLTEFTTITMEEIPTEASANSGDSSSNIATISPDA